MFALKKLCSPYAIGIERNLIRDWHCQWTQWVVSRWCWSRTTTKCCIWDSTQAFAAPFYHPDDFRQHWSCRLSKKLQLQANCHTIKPIASKPISAPERLFHQFFFGWPEMNWLLVYRNKCVSFTKNSLFLKHTKLSIYIRTMEYLITMCIVHHDWKM